MKKQQITVRVPASTSNLGPGFDCLGVALRLYNYVTVARSGADQPEPMVGEAAAHFWSLTAVDRFPFTCSIAGDVPRSRGLGSSVTVRLGVLHGLNELTGRTLHREQLFDACTALEGHPDNAAPAAFGGFNVTSANRRQTFPVSPKLRFVLLMPELEMKTESARAVLPDQVDRRGAVQSCGNACTITAAFVSRRYDQLRSAFVDYLHQPFRRTLLPFFDDVIAAADQAGALGAWLSGSGSTIAAVTDGAPDAIGAAMLAAAGTSARVVVTTADNRGTRVVSRSRIHAPLA